MNASTVALGVVAAALTVAYALCDSGGHQILAIFGRAVVRLVTFGRVHLGNADEGSAVAIAALVVVATFFALLLAIAILG